MKSSFLLIINLFLLLPFFSKSVDITLTITKETDPTHSKLIGPQGTFALYTDAENLDATVFDPDQIESQTQFEGLFSDGEKTYKWICSLFDPNDRNVSVKCTVDDTIKDSSNYHFRLESGTIQKDGNTINIKSEEDYYFDIEMKSYNIPFIYSDSQKINLEEDVGYYELRFKVNSYQEENKLALISKTDGNPYSFTDFDEIKLESNELICNISKIKIEMITTNLKVLNLVYLNGDLGLVKLEFAGDINIEYLGDKKEIEIRIGNPINSRSENKSLIAFETNITDISPLTSDRFDLLLSNKIDSIKCFFKKYDKKPDLPLILLCENYHEQFYLDEDNKPYLNEINYKYIFNVALIRNYNPTRSSGNGKQILLTYPETLDFTKNNEYIIEFFMFWPENFNNIRFVENSPVLE